MNKSEIERFTKESLELIMEEYKFELVDVEYIKEGPHMYLRIYIDKPEGITLEDCQKISERMSEVLDEADPIEENYFLEVSSPGLDRPLKTDKDLEKNQGKDVDINLYKPINGKKRYSGKLLSFDINNITVEDEELGETLLDREIISKINLAFKF